MSPTGAQLWEMVPAIVGAIVGAAVAALPAYWLARRANHEVLSRDAEQRLAQDQIRGFRLLTTFISISNSIFTFQGMIAMMLEREIGEEEETPNQRRISAITGLSLEVNERFSPNDLALIASLNDINLVTDMMQLAAAHASIASSLEEYKKLKLEGHKLLAEGVDHEVQGELIKTTISDPQLRAKIRINGLQSESLITQVISMVDEQAAASLDVGQRFNSAMERLFPAGKRPHVDLTEAVKRLAS